MVFRVDTCLEKQWIWFWVHSCGHWSCVCSPSRCTVGCHGVALPVSPTSTAHYCFTALWNGSQLRWQLLWRDGCVQTTKLDHNQSRLRSQPALSYCCIPAFILAWQAHMVGSPLNAGCTVLFILLFRKLGETLTLCGHASLCTSVPLCRVPCDASFNLFVGDFISKTCILLVRHIYVPFLVVVGNCAIEKYGWYDSLLLECFLAHFWILVTLC